MNTAIVTGAAGFVGRWVVRELIEHGVKVYAVVRKNSSHLGKLPESELLTVVTCNLDEIEKLPDLILDDQIDVFYHLAWEGVSGFKQKDYGVQLANIQAVMKVTDILLELGVKKFIGAGSISEMECLMEMGQQEISVNMGNMYKSAKIAAHYMAKVNTCRQGIDFLWPILTNAYGCGEMSGRLVVSTLKKLLNEEPPAFTLAEQNYDFVYISDVARAFRLLGESGISCRDYIIGSGSARKLRSYLEYMGAAVNPKVELQFGAHPFKGIYLPLDCFCTDQLVNDTGFQIDVSFEDGITKMLEWLTGK